MLDATVKNALEVWGLNQASSHLVAQRENSVFHIQTTPGEQYALRLHRPGYHSLNALHSELLWMQYLAENGLNVPVPVATSNGELIISLDTFYIDMVSWLDGEPMGESGVPLTLENPTSTFEQMGETMARVHELSDQWERPEHFERPHWDLDGLLGESPLWDKFWNNPGLNQTQRQQVLVARDRLRRKIADTQLDYGLIHADMVRENVLLCFEQVNNSHIGLIDFDDGGFGFRLFDVATALYKNRDEPNASVLNDAFLNGYRSIRQLDTSLLPSFMLVRSLSYLGWIISRLHEPNAARRQERFLAASMPMVDEYLRKT